MAPVAVIIPTLDNRPYLEPCLRSLRATTQGSQVRVSIANNGERRSCTWAFQYQADVYDVRRNVGWEGGLLLGLQETDEPLVLFLNDDTFFPPSSTGWLARLVGHLADPCVGAVGPASNYVAGAQSIFADVPWYLLAMPCLIGFCMLVRRDALVAAGGVTTDCRGADDRDLSIRLIDAGYTLVADRSVFVYHHGAVTGKRVMGSVFGPGGWYGPDTLAAHRQALVDKHGEERVLAMEQGQPTPYARPLRAWTTPAKKP